MSRAKRSVPINAKRSVPINAKRSPSFIKQNIGWAKQRVPINAKRKGERAEYGKQLIEKLARDLTGGFGKGWSNKQLHYCLPFAETFPDGEIVSTLSRQLSWSHFRNCEI